MKKKIAITVAALCLMAAFMTVTSDAAISPHFMAVNDTLLPFSDSTMPYVSGGLILVPYGILAMAGVRSTASDDLEMVRLYISDLQADFFPSRGATEDGYGNSLGWPSSMKIGGSLYVPLYQVCEYFGIRFELIEVGRNVIPDKQIWVVRIISEASLTSSGFVNRYRNSMLNAYNEYYAAQPQASPTGGGEEPAEPPPDYSGVTVYLSFSGISSGSAEPILDLLSAGSVSGYPSCFFVSRSDIEENPGLVRRISAGGHAVGIYLDEGAPEEYLETSALLYEAAKIKTVLISAPAPDLSEEDAPDADGELSDSEEPAAAPPETAADAAAATANECGLIYWGVSWDVAHEEEIDEDRLADILPTGSGERWNLAFDCSERTASILPGILAYLRTYNYTVSFINETATPVR